MRRNQTGSIIGFIIVGGLLTLLLLGGAYIVRHNLTPAGGGAPVASQNSDTTTDKPADTGSGAATEENKPANDGTVLPGSADTEAQPEPSHGAPSGLPQTGPADALVGGVLLSGIVAAGAAYKRSRDLLASL